MAPLALAAAEVEWLNLFHELRKRSDRDELAGPFLSVPPQGYDPMKRPSILFIGKATNDTWNLDGDPGSLTIETTRRCTTRFLEEHAATYGGGFWPFARDLSEQIAPTGPLLQNLVWTNICKIGMVSGVPPQRIRKARRDLAAKTLPLEIQVYSPKLIVLVTGNFEANEVVCKLFGDRKCWNEKYGDFWWQEAHSDMPAILWTDHPERKGTGRREGWIGQAKKLILN